MKPETLSRISSRITKEQHQYIKKFAKKNKLTEGEALRAIIAGFIKNK